eukprot:84683-Chlamydomonas_euryale.AAC.1
MPVSTPPAQPHELDASSFTPHEKFAYPTASMTAREPLTELVARHSACAAFPLVHALTLVVVCSPGIKFRPAAPGAELRASISI